MGAKLNLEQALHNPFSPPLFGAKLDLALGTKYNLEGAKVQGFRVKLLTGLKQNFRLVQYASNKRNPTRAICSLTVGNRFVYP